MRSSVLASLAMLPLAFAIQTASAAASESLWQPSTQLKLSASADIAAPERVRALRLDTAGLHAFLDRGAARGESLALPRPQGGFEEFVLSNSDTLPPALAAKYPQIRSYVGTTIDGRRARIDVSPQGLEAMVFDNEGVWVIQPKSFRDHAARAAGASEEYISAARNDLGVPGEGFRCAVHGQPQGTHVNDKLPWITSRASVKRPTGATRREYTIAVGATFEYVTAVSNGRPANVEDGLAAVTAAINRVNEVYERELGIHLTLADNNDRVIYTTRNDPYSNNDNDSSVNTGVLNRQIGAADYDVGHVFTTRSGNAYLGVVCDAVPDAGGIGKGAGTTGSANPRGDAFWIDYVAHEIGHQFNGDHTFNSSSDGSCNAANRNADTAYEPGSGSTIQAYAGICGASNLQANSDPHFHAISLEQISDFTADDGAICATERPSPHAAPVIAPALADFIIPARTPFVLTAAAQGAAGGVLTYSWEQYDLGRANGGLNNDPGNGPIIRSLVPSRSASRTIPRLDHLLAGTRMPGETLPTTSRNLNFRLTVRDTLNGYGTTNSDDMTVRSVNTGAAFAVSAPNTAVDWAVGSNQTVRWNVAGTAEAPIACARVGLDLSIDGGLTFAHHLGTFANTGSANVVIPNAVTNQARIKASCVGNIFFNISAPNFTISAAAAGGGGVQTYTNTTDFNIPDNNSTGISSSIAVAGRAGNAPNNASISVDIVHPWVGDLTLDLIAPDGTVYNLRTKTGYDADNIKETYTKDLSTEPLNGTWKLRARDSGRDDVGYINSWSIRF